MSVGTLEEIIDDNHAIVSTSVGSEHYVSILSFVDKDLLEPGCSVLLNHKVTAGPWVEVCSGGKVMQAHVLNPFRLLTVQCLNEVYAIGVLGFCEVYNVCVCVCV